MVYPNVRAKATLKKGTFQELHEGLVRFRSRLPLHAISDRVQGLSVKRGGERGGSAGGR